MAGRNHHFRICSCFPLEGWRGPEAEARTIFHGSFSMGTSSPCRNLIGALPWMTPL
jgi:hypothetical protein